LSDRWGPTARAPVDGDTTVSTGHDDVAIAVEDRGSNTASVNGVLDVAATRISRLGSGHARIPPCASPVTRNGWSSVGGRIVDSRKPWPRYDAMTSVARSSTVTVPVPPAAMM
jgi:hypothetical protein